MFNRRTKPKQDLRKGSFYFGWTVPLTPVFRKVWCNVIREQHIFNNLVNLFCVYTSEFSKKKEHLQWPSCICMCWCNPVFFVQVNRGRSPCFLSSCWTTTWQLESWGSGMGLLPWPFPSAARQLGDFCSLSTGRECVLLFCNKMMVKLTALKLQHPFPAKSRFAINVAGMVLEAFVLWISPCTFL